MTDSLTIDLFAHAVSWEYYNRYITILNFPEKATVLPDDFHQKLVDRQEAGEVDTISWRSDTGWVGINLIDFENYEIWYMQKDIRCLQVTN